MTLAGPSFRTRFVSSVQPEAVWKFALHSQGKWSLALPSVRDARRAAEWLPRSFGELVQLKSSWGSFARK